MSSGGVHLNKQLTPRRVRKRLVARISRNPSTVDRAVALSLGRWQPVGGPLWTESDGCVGLVEEGL